MGSTVKRGPWLEEEFTKEGESYLVNDGYVEGFRALITPREGFFDLEVYRNEYEYERDDDIGVHVEYHRETYLKSRELTVDNIRTAVRDFELAVPDNLANELTEWQEKYWDSNKIEPGSGTFEGRVTPEEIEMAYGGEAPEETSERLRVEFGSALAEAQGVAEFAPEAQGLIQRDGYSEYVRGGVTVHYIIHVEDYAHVKIEPTQGVFDVEVNEVRFADVTVFPDDNLPAGVVPGEAYIEQHLKRLDVTVEDVQKTLAELSITIPAPLVEKLSEWRREFFNSEGYADVRHMAETESGDSGGRLTPEDVEKIYGPDERLRMFGPALTEAERGANYESPKIAVENFDAPAPRIPFIEDALDAGATVDHISIRHHGSDWTVVSFENAKGTYFVKGEDVYVTQASVLEAQAAIEADPVTLPRIEDVKPAGDIEIETADVSFSQVVDSMGLNNRAILEKALADGAVVSRFWAERSEGDSGRYAMAVVSFEDAPGTYIFWNGEDGAQNTRLDFGATRYALDFGYEIGDLKPVNEIRSEGNRVEPRGRSADYAMSM
jgi:hypothetical protein